MSKLDDTLGGTKFIKVSDRNSQINDMGIDRTQLKNTKQEIKDLMLELIGDMDQRETSDMALKSWTNEDYKAFGKNELKAELRRKVVEL